MKITKWKPKNQDLLNDFFDEPFWGVPFIPQAGRLGSRISNGFYPDIDIREDKNAYVVKADLPGIKKDDIALEIHGSTLSIKGERKSEEESKEKGFYRIERSYGSFQRSFDLGEPIDQSKVTAKYKDGVLEITIPKSEQTKARNIQIQSD